MSWSLLLLGPVAGLQNAGSVGARSDHGRQSTLSKASLATASVQGHALLFLRFTRVTVSKLSCYTHFEIVLGNATRPRDPAWSYFVQCGADGSSNENRLFALLWNHAEKVV